MKYISITMCTKSVCRNLQTTVEEIKDLNKWGDPPYAWIERLNILRIDNSSKIDLFIQIWNSDQTCNKLFCKYQHTI